METLEGNKLIAEFDGAELIDMWVKSLGNMRGFLFPNKKEFAIDELKYHTSWDWLMPVCKKINHTAPPKDHFKKMEEYWDLIDNSITQNYEITETWPFVVQFIQWYNTTLNK